MARAGVFALDLTMASSGTFVMPIGKHKGKTLDAIAAAGHRGYIEWAAANMSDKRIQAAAASFLESTASERSAPLLSMPASIAATATLSPGAKLVFGVIFTAADQDPLQRCTLSNEDLQAKTALSGKQVKRLLVELEALGLIARVVSGTRRSHIAITWTTAWPATAAEGTLCPLSAGTPCPPWEGPDEIGSTLERPGKKPIRITAKRIYHRPLS
jgi:hypothetical protein